jgi:hypothetical protein
LNKTGRQGHPEPKSSTLFASIRYCRIIVNMALINVIHSLSR